MMDGIELKELFKVAVETLREKTIVPLLEADATYQEDSENEGIAEMHYLQLDLTEEQRKVCNRLLSAGISKILSMLPTHISQVYMTLSA
ncbi:MAG: hypothetical protein ACLTTZ_00280 [Lachnospiraceae bacterium]